MQGTVDKITDQSVFIEIGVRRGGGPDRGVREGDEITSAGRPVDARQAPRQRRLRRALERRASRMQTWDNERPPPGTTVNGRAPTGSRDGMRVDIAHPCLPSGGRLSPPGAQPRRVRKRRSSKRHQGQQERAATSFSPGRPTSIDSRKEETLRTRGRDLARAVKHITEYGPSSNSAASKACLHTRMSWAPIRYPSEIFRSKRRSRSRCSSSTANRERVSLGTRRYLDPCRR